MKLIILVLAIVAVNGKPVADSAGIKNNGANYIATELAKIFGGLDAELRDDIENTKVRARTVIMDSSRALGDRYKDIAEITQQAADLWKQATPKQNQAPKNPIRYIASDKEQEESAKFFAGVDALLRFEIMKAMAQVTNIVADSNITLGDKYKEIAAVTQQTADLWKQVAKKNEAPVTAA